MTCIGWNSCYYH